LIVEHITTYSPVETE